MTTEEEFERTEARTVVDSFDERFRKQYGEGHLLMACHAAFPIAVTPDMLYQIWANFRKYSDNPADKPIDRLAVSDVLLWHCWQEVDPDVYELNTAVRACLLDILRQDSRFGEIRLQELARFLYQYTERIIQNQQGSVFREAQRWTAMATLALAEATTELANKLKEAAVGSVGPDGLNVPDEPEVMRLRNVLEALTGQQEQFRGMLYVSKALKGHYLGYGADIIGQQINLAKQQRGYGLTTDIKPDEPFITIPMPADLPNEVALPAKPVSKLYLLTVGIDAYEGMPLRGCVNDARLLLDTFSEYSPNPVTYNRLLIDKQATKANILTELEKILREAGHDDMVVFTFSGHGQNHNTRDKAEQNTLVTYGTENMVLGRSNNDLEKMVSCTITETEFREIVQKAGENDPYVLLITDTHNGSPNWLSLTNPKHIVMAAGSDWETVFETYTGSQPHGAFTAALVAALHSSNRFIPQTYRSLIRKIHQTMQDRKYEQTPQLFGTETALKRPFLSTDDSGILYATELTRYRQQSPAADEPLAAVESADLQALINLVLVRYAGSSPSFSETSKTEITKRLEQAVTTSDQPQGLSVVGIGGANGLSFMDQWENQIRARVEIIAKTTTANIAKILFKSDTHR